MTVLELLRSSLRLIDQLRPGRSPGPTETTDALLVLNSFLDQCNAQRMAIYTINPTLYSLVANQQVYTIGPLGDFDDVRPVRIESANLLYGSSPLLRRPLKLLTRAQWAAKTIQSVVTFPSELYNDGSWPASSLYFYPIPNQAYQVELYTWSQLIQVPDTSLDVDFPPGYADFIRYELAIRLGVEWGRPIRPEVRELARQARGVIQTHNVPSSPIATEPGLSPESGGLYNYSTGQNET